MGTLGNTKIFQSRQAGQRQVQGKAVSFRGDLEDEDGREQAPSQFEASNNCGQLGMTEPENAVSSGDSFEEEDSADHATITKRENGAIQEQGNRAIQDQQKVRNRIYFECLNVAEEVLI